MQNSAFIDSWLVWIVSNEWVRLVQCYRFTCLWLQVTFWQKLQFFLWSSFSRAYHCILHVFWSAYKIPETSWGAIQWQSVCCWITMLNKTHEGLKPEYLREINPYFYIVDYLLIYSRIISINSMMSTRSRRMLWAIQLFVFANVSVSTGILQWCLV